MKRLFIALDISDNQNVIEIYDDLKKRLSGDKIKWVKPENMHITLRFLGSTPEEKVEKIMDIIKTTVKNRQQITLDFSRVGIFGSSYKPRVIWLGFKENKELGSISENLKQKLVGLGFEYDRQNFVPHLTLGRIGKIESKKYFQSVISKHQNLNIPPVTIDAIYLYESVLHKDGPEYRIVGEVRLEH